MHAPAPLGASGRHLPRRDRWVILRPGLGDSDMAKKRIASVDLGWIILEQLKEEKEFPVRMSLAVIPDEESGRFDMYPPILNTTQK